eukprot:COSAG01_NODE_2042_length_8567_cov_430.763935_3_plen_88_part_00
MIFTEQAATQIFSLFSVIDGRCLFRAGFEGFIDLCEYAKATFVNKASPKISIRISQLVLNFVNKMFDQTVDNRARNASLAAIIMGYI